MKFRQLSLFFLDTDSFYRLEMLFILAVIGSSIIDLFLFFLTPEMNRFVELRAVT